MEDFAALGPLQDRYFELVRTAGKDVADPKAFPPVAEFVAKAVAAGKWVDAPEDRAAAQNYINYWVSRVASAVRLAERTDDGPRARTDSTPRFAETVLAPFDPATLEEGARGAERWLASHPDRAATARRILLRLARLQPDGETFEALPTFRSAFFDFAEPGEVNEILKGLEDAGAVRTVRGTRPELDTVALRSPLLLEAQFDALWPTYAEWRDGRRQFRRNAGNWNRTGGRAALDPDAFEDARLYHDRDRSEWDFLKAVRNAEQKRRDTIVFGLVLAGICVGVLLPLAITAWRGWARSEANAIIAEGEKNAAELAKLNADSQKAIAIREKDKADSANRAMEAQSDLVGRVECIRTLAEIGAARTDAELAIGLNRWKSLLDRFERQNPKPDRLLATVRLRFPDVEGGVVAVARKARDLKPPERKNILTLDLFDREIPWYNGADWRAFNRRVLKLAREFRNELVDRSDPLIENELMAIRDAAYKRVRLCLDKFLGTVGGQKSFDDAAPYVREFWMNYWGDLGLVESPDVADAMRELGDKLTKIEDRLPRYAFQDFFRSYGRNLRERSDSRYGKSFPAMITSLDSFTDHFRLYSRMVRLSEIDELDGLIIGLKTAMVADIELAVQRHDIEPMAKR